MRHVSEFPIESPDSVLLTATTDMLVQPVGVRSFYARFVKRPLDVMVVLMLAPIVLTVLLVLIGIMLWQGQKPFYTQMRVGRSGRAFRLWKLKTMVDDADLRLSEYLEQNPEAKAEWDLTQKLKRDPRITPSGSFLRKTSLDELPQLWNVLIGDMSLVGPRPMMVEQAQLYPGADYYHLRPGVTGPWQVSDRNDSTFAARATFDAHYAADLSLSLDMKIFAKTAGVVLRCTGY